MILGMDHSKKERSIAEKYLFPAIRLLRMLTDNPTCQQTIRESLILIKEFSEFQAAGNRVCISECRKVEEELKEVNSIINRSSTVAFTWKNMEGWPVKFVTKNVKKLFGYTAEEFLSGAISYSECIHPDDLQRVANEVEKFSKEDGRTEFVHEPYRIIAKDGTTRIISDWTFIVRNDQKQITYYKGIVEDITDRIRVEEELKERIRLIHIILDSLPFPAMVVRKDRVVMAANEVARNVGAKAGGFCWRDFGQSNYISEEDKNLSDNHKDVAERGIHCDFCLADEAINFNKFQNIPELHAFGGIWDTYWIPINDGMFLHFATDITEQKRIEQKLKKRTHDLRERVKELRCLFGISELIQSRNKSHKETLQAVVDIIPSSLQYPEITCARLTIEDYEIKTANFRKTAWQITSKIKESGLLEIGYLEERPTSDEGPFMKEERALIEAITGMFGRYIEHKKAEDALLQANEKLAIERQALKEKNITLKEVLGQIEEEKRQIAFQTQSNVDRVVLPVLNKLDEKMQSDDKTYVSLLRNSLTEITHPFINNLKARFLELTPREIEICNMIKNGLSSKEIASVLNTAVGTVFNQRKTIRKKLGIANDNINLSSFLHSN